MSIPIWKDHPEMDGIMNLEDAKELLKASAEIQKFIESTSQSLSRKISNNLYDAIETKAIKAGEYSFHIGVVEDYAKDYEKDHNCELRVTENVLEEIAFRIGEIFRENGFHSHGYIVPKNHECVIIEISGWDEE